MRSAILVLILFTVPAIAYSAVIEVPKDYPTIQAAIDAAHIRDTIIVGPGTYVENIDFKGKGITVKSSDGAIATVIDGNKNGSVVTFTSGEIYNSVLDGFSIIKGENQIGGGGIFCDSASPTIINNIISWNLSGPGNWQNGGGGIYCNNSAPTINNNIISMNDSFSCPGGGIYCYTSSPIITNNTILWNHSGNDGGGIWCRDSSPVITNNLITRNYNSYTGGGIYCGNSSPTITNCTITENYTADWGGGISCSGYGSPNITNCIFWNNTADFGLEIYYVTISPTVTYCNVKGGWPGIGNFNADPLFVKGPTGFLYLSQISAGQLVDSPCIDAGSDLACNLDMDKYWTRTDKIPDSGTVDIGFHYFENFSYLSLQVDSYEISARNGGIAHFYLHADFLNAKRNYLIAGSVSGTDPGIILPGGGATLPFVWDSFTFLILANHNTPFLNKFIGKLGNAGSGSASLNTFGPIDPALVGVTMYFAYALNKPWDFASNSVSIKIVP